VFEEEMVPDRCQNAERSEQKQVNRKGRVQPAKSEEVDTEGTHKFVYYVHPTSIVTMRWFLSPIARRSLLATGTPLGLLE
jgi:hypothetical protein